jgi:predicted CXXCH cytochrome family protein
LTGGVSKVSCFSTDKDGISCHPQGPSGHPAGWSAPAAHGARAKAAPSATQGFLSCTQCHGADYAGGSGTSCMACHTTAPHPATPWRGTTATGTTHTTTNEGNVSQCARCHLNNARLATPVAVPAGTTPGCFNGTLCHATVGHPAGWAATGHQVAAKAAAGASSGLDYCRTCHGTDFRGGTANVSCFSCHTSSPHSKPWLGSTGATTHIHSTTDTTNALACGRCHAGGVKLSTPTTPPTNAGCFNSTLCHGTPTSHAFPYGGSLHRPGGTGTVLANTSAPYTNCSGCHDTTTAGGTYPVASGVRPLCSGCHLNMANFTSTTPGCWDCHGASATDGRPSGTSFPNRQGSADGHNRNTHRLACTFCHPITTGSASHGWSNGAKSSNAQVKTILFWDPGTRASGTGTCNPSAGGISSGCHGSKTGWY